MGFHRVEELVICRWPRFFSRRSAEALTYDVIVVGAGPAGSTAAYDCTKQGLKTLLLEKYKLPREKPCGGAVMYRALRTIGEKIPPDLRSQISPSRW